MAASVSLIVLYPNGRRQIVKANKDTSIWQVLEDACKQQQLNPADHELFHHNRKLNPTLLVSLTGLPNNAEVELRQGQGQGPAATATICLQTESGERLTDSFPPGTTLWDILCHWEKKVGLAKLQGAQAGEPVCVYMRLEIAGKEHLRDTTLQKLGLIGGKAVIRLLFRPSAVMGEQAHVSRNYTVPFKDAERTVPASTEPPVAATERRENREPPRPTPCTNAEKKSGVRDAPVKREGADEERQPPRQETRQKTEESQLVIREEDIKYIGERKAVLFDLEHSFPFTIEEPGEDFFEVTLEDAKYLAADYQRQRRELEERPLETESLRRTREVRRAREYSSALIRIYFPDRLVLQGTFSPEEKVADVIDFVRGFLRHGSQDFYLYTSPPKTVLDLGSTLLEADLVPASVVHFGGGASTTGPLLRSDVLARISTPGGASVAAVRLWSKRSLLEQSPMREEPPRPSPPTVRKDVPERRVARAPDPAPEARRPSSGSAGKAPKWFTMGKK